MHIIKILFITNIQNSYQNHLDLKNIH